MKLVVAVDPGKMSGLAYPNGSAQLEMMPLLDYVEEMAERHGPQLIIVCESYTITMETVKKSRQTWSLEIIGCLRRIAHKNGCEFVLQSPADAKRFATDTRLKDAGMWVKGQDHARDAYRHLLLFLAKSGQISIKSYE